MRRSLVSIAIPAALALLLLGLGIPQTADSIVWVLAGGSPSELGAASPPSDAEVAHAIALLEGIDKWVPDPRARIRAGILRLRRVATDSNDADRAADRDRAIADLTSGLLRSPANAVGWAALASGELDAGNLAKAKAALLTSMLIDDHDPQLNLWRCALGLPLWNMFDADGRRLWSDQVREAWQVNRADLIALARQDGGVYVPRIRFALISDPDQLAEFDQAIKHP